MNPGFIPQGLRTHLALLPSLAMVDTLLVRSVKHAGDRVSKFGHHRAARGPGLTAGLPQQLFETSAPTAVAARDRMLDA
jgi:hypothetical protein